METGPEILYHDGPHLEIGGVQLQDTESKGSKNLKEAGHGHQARLALRV